MCMCPCSWRTLHTAFYSSYVRPCARSLVHLLHLSFSKLFYTEWGWLVGWLVVGVEFSRVPMLWYFISCNSIANRAIATWIKLSIIVMRWKYTKPHTYKVAPLFALCQNLWICEWSFPTYCRYFLWFGFSQPFTTFRYIEQNDITFHSSCTIHGV